MTSIGAEEQALVGTLRTIETILQKHGIADRGDVQSAIADATAGRVDFADRLAGLSIWGGSGSLADVELTASSLAQPDAAIDQRLLQTALISVAEYILAHGIGTDRMRARVRQIADTFRLWNDMP